MSGFNIDLLPVDLSGKRPVIDVIVRPSERDLGPPTGTILGYLCNTEEGAIDPDSVDAIPLPGEELFGLRLMLSANSEPENVRRVIFERLRKYVKSITVPNGRKIPENYVAELPLIFQGCRS